MSYQPIENYGIIDELPKSALESVDAFISKSESPARLLEIVEHLLYLRRLQPEPESRGAATRSVRGMW